MRTPLTLIWRWGLTWAAAITYPQEQAPSARLALLNGNAASKTGPARNPVNDARAMP